MYIQCLGSGNAFSDGGRLNSCYYLRTDDHHILLDCGATALAALKTANISSSSIDVIIISHLHGDHFGGLPFILCEAISYQRRNKLVIIGPEEIEARTLKALRIFYPDVADHQTANIEFKVYKTSGAFQYSGISIEAFEAVHAPATHPHSLRITVDGNIIAYSGDTAWNENFFRLTENAKLFICEASSYDKANAHHMCVKQLIEEHVKLNVKKIVLSHLGKGKDTIDHLDKISLHAVSDFEVLLRN